MECASKEEVERHLELGKKFLAAGQMADALSQYHAAVGMYQPISQSINQSVSQSKDEVSPAKRPPQPHAPISLKCMHVKRAHRLLVGGAVDCEDRLVFGSRKTHVQIMICTVPP